MVSPLQTACILRLVFMGYKALSPQPQLGQLCRAVPADALELSAGPAKASVTAPLLPLPNLTSLTPPTGAIPKAHFNQSTCRVQRLRVYSLETPTCTSVAAWRLSKPPLQLGLTQVRVRYCPRSGTRRTFFYFWVHTTLAGLIQGPDLHPTPQSGSF